jgi:hypothetical protein
VITFGFFFFLLDLSLCLSLSFLFFNSLTNGAYIHQCTVKHFYYQFLSTSTTISATNFQAIESDSFSRDYFSPWCGSQLFTPPKRLLTACHPNPMPGTSSYFYLFFKSMYIALGENLEMCASSNTEDGLGVSLLGLE